MKQLRGFLMRSASRLANAVGLTTHAVQGEHSSSAIARMASAVHASAVLSPPHLPLPQSFPLRNALSESGSSNPGTVDYDPRPQPPCPTGSCSIPVIGPRKDTSGSSRPGSAEQILANWARASTRYHNELSCLSVTERVELFSGRPAQSMDVSPSTLHPSLTDDSCFPCSVIPAWIGPWIERTRSLSLRTP